MNNLTKKVAILLYFFNSITFSQENARAYTIEGEPYTRNLAAYEIAHGSQFNLCRDFVSYLNRKPPFFYFQELKLDAGFEELNIPILTEVNREHGITIVNEKLDSFYKERLKRALSEKEVLELKKKHEKNRFPNEPNVEHTFYTAHIDVNHSGIKDFVLIIKYTSQLAGRNSQFERKTIGVNGSLFRYVFLNEDLTYKHYRVSDMGGHPFYYLGRFYTAYFNYTSLFNSTTLSVFIHEPKVPALEKQGVYQGRAVCQLTMTRYIETEKN